MAIEFVGSRYESAGGSTTVSDTEAVAPSGGFPPFNVGSRASLQIGDMIIAAYATGSGADRTLSITDGTNPYNLIGSELYSNDTYDTNLRVAYKFVTSNPSSESITFGPSGDDGDGAAFCWMVFSGVDQTNPFDVAVQTATGVNSGIANPPAITPVTAGSKIVVVGASGHKAGTTAYSNAALSGVLSSNNTDTNNAVCAMGYHDWVSGAYDPAPWTWSGVDSSSYSWAAMTIALRPAAGGIKVWGGSSWTEKPVKVWNGSSWVSKPLKLWNGSSWIVP